MSPIVAAARNERGLFAFIPPDTKFGWDAAMKAGWWVLAGVVAGLGWLGLIAFGA